MDIMQANLGSNPSYVWRSLCWGRELLREGLKRGIANGRSIDASSRNWFGGWGLSDKSSCRRADCKVSKYILANGRWNEGLVKNDLLMFEVTDILNTLINMQRPEDYRYWSPHPKGIYTVRSGYLLLSERAFFRENEERPGGSGKSKEWWNSI